MNEMHVEGPLSLVQPGPYALALSVPSDGSKAAVLRVENPNGSFVVVMAPDDALEFGQSLVALGQQLKTGIVLPPSQEVVDKIVKEGMKGNGNG